MGLHSPHLVWAAAPSSTIRHSASCVCGVVSWEERPRMEGMRRCSSAAHGDATHHTNCLVEVIVRRCRPDVSSVHHMSKGVPFRGPAGMCVVACWPRPCGSSVAVSFRAGASGRSCGRSSCLLRAVRFLNYYWHGICGCRYLKSRRRSTMRYVWILGRL